MEGYEYPIFLSKPRVILKPPPPLPLSAARISSRHSLGRDESENSSLCSREMTYCLPRIWVLHRARARTSRRRVIRLSSSSSSSSSRALREADRRRIDRFRQGSWFLTSVILECNQPYSGCRWPETCNLGGYIVSFEFGCRILLELS